MALPGTHLQGHLVVLAMLVSCWVIIVGRGGWGWGWGLGLLSLRLPEAQQQLEGRLGHWVWHVVSNVNLRSVGGRRLRGPPGGGRSQGGGRWQTAH